MDFDDVYLQELSRLRTLGREFAQEQPMVASYLSGESSDPDIERLMQGFAFLTSLVRLKLEDETPEFINDVVSLVGTDIAGRLPAITVLKLDGVGVMPNGMVVPSGSEFSSEVVDDAPYIFTTSWPLTIQPLQLNSCALESLGKNSRISLNVSLKRLLLAQWSGDKVSIYLSGSYPEAANIAFNILHKLKGVSARFGEGADARSFPLSIHFPGLDPEQAIFPVQATVANHLRWARQSLTYPERAFFIELSGFSAVPKPPGISDFSIDFDFIDDAQATHRITNADFTLNAVPAVNLFETSATPIQRSTIRESYLISPLGLNSSEVEVFDVKKVTGSLPGSPEEYEYYSTASVFSANTRQTYQVIVEDGVKAGTSFHYLRLPFRDFNTGLDLAIDKKHVETLSLLIRCTNGRMAQHLRLGDINSRTPKSPEKLTVTNVIVPTGASTPAIGSDGMWKIAAHARLNLGAAANVATLKELLTLYLPEGGEDVGRVNAARRRIEGLRSVSRSEDTRLIRGNLYSGSIVTIELNRTFYSSTGDLYLFAYILAYTLAGFTELNSYVTVRVHDIEKGELYEWPYLLSLNQVI